MSIRFALNRVLVHFACVILVIIVPGDVLAQRGRGNSFNTGAVGGVMIDADGVLRNAEIAEFGLLRRARQAAMEAVPQGVARPSELRKISLRRLQAAIRQRREAGLDETLTDEMLFLAGLTRVEYVFVYPESGDIVLAGPAEGWKIGERGSFVGATSGKATLHLHHLLVAFRTAEAASTRPITCSIDPTAQGLQRLQAFLRTQRTFNVGTMSGIEKSLGPQQVVLANVPENCDFARTMVAADFRMKRLAMNFDRSPVRGIPSYLSMISASSSGLQSMTPRWWMAPNYETLLRDKDGLVWQLRGPGVKIMTEDSFIEATGGKVEQAGRSSAAARRWAELMTKHFEEIGRHYPVFGRLRNIMDMSVVAALMIKERLPERANCNLNEFLDEELISVDAFPAPRQIDTQASVVKQRGSYIISASGGVEISTWLVAQQSEINEQLTPFRAAHSTAADNWWWD